MVQSALVESQPSTLGGMTASTFDDRVIEVAHRARALTNDVARLLEETLTGDAWLCLDTALDHLVCSVAELENL